MTETSAELVHFDRARTELALARSIDEVKTIRDKAEAMRAYIRQQKGSLEMQNHCAEIKLRAERKAGELLAERDKHPGGRPSKTDDIVSPVLPPKLADIGVTAKQSERWQLEASVPEEVFEQHIAEVKAKGEELTSTSVVQLGARLKRAEQAQEVSRVEMSLPDAPSKYRTIVIDPPWPIQKIERENRPLQGQALDYPTMTLDEIAALPVAETAHPDGCHLYLWVTHKYLPAGLALIEGWGFRYQCVMTWVKNVGFTPFSWMYSTEHVLFARLGGLDLLRMGLRLDFAAKVREHSRKPEEFYDLVRQASPGLRLEMFARQRREGFECWGNQVDHFA